MEERNNTGDRLEKASCVRLAMENEWSYAGAKAALLGEQVLQAAKGASSDRTPVWSDGSYHGRDNS